MRSLFLTNIRRSICLQIEFFQWIASYAGYGNKIQFLGE